MATPVERRAARTVGAGVIVLALIGALLFLTFKAQTGAPFRTITTVQAEFKDIHSLRTNDDIRANSKRIGRVSALDYAPDGSALVTMEIDGDYPVYNDATAAIWDYSALATKFVELNAGTPGAGPLAGNVIKPERTDSSKDLNQVLEIFDAPTRTAATSSIRELGTGLAGHAPDLQSFLGSAPGLLNDLGTVSDSLTGPGTDLRGVLTSADRLTGTLQGRSQQIDALVGDADRTMAALAVDHGTPLGNTLRRAPGTLAALRPALDKLDQPLADTEATVRTLQPGAQALGQATPDLRGVLTDAPPILGKVPGVADSAKPAVESLTDTASQARPLVPRAGETLSSVRDALTRLAPYSPEIGSWILRVQSFVSEGADPGTRYARIGLAPGIPTVTGGLVKSGSPYNVPYPAPGQDPKTRDRGGLPQGLPIGGGGDDLRQDTGGGR
jgi:phospholipid/cholesterol/gamma-HCH transport system substrate-binding protein